MKKYSRVFKKFERPRLPSPGSVYVGGTSFLQWVSHYPQFKHGLGRWRGSTCHNKRSEFGSTVENFLSPLEYLFKFKSLENISFVMKSQDQLYLILRLGKSLYMINVVDHVFYMESNLTSTLTRLKFGP